MRKSNEMTKTTRTVFSVLLVTACLAILLFCFSDGISGNDFWWHVKVGEWILQNHSIPTRDIFSWYGMNKGFSWTSHEWLSEVILWLLFRGTGDGGVFVFSVLSSVLMLFLLVWQMRKHLLDNCLTSALYLCLFSVLSSLFFYGRPHVFSFFLLYGELYCLYEFGERRHTGLVYLIPIIACLWSNLHGGSSNLSYLLVGLTILCGLGHWRIGRLYSIKWSRRELVQLLIVLGMTVGMLCVNPSGSHMLLYPYECMADPVMMHTISEWAAPDAKNIGELVLYFLPIFMLCSGILFGRQEVRAWDAALMLVFLLLFFRSVRFIVLFYISAAFWAFPYQLPCGLQKIEKPVEKVLTIVLEIGLIFLIGLSIKDCSQTWKNGILISKALGEEMTAFIKQDAPERLFNDYNYGGALIYEGIPVFVDERADMYAKEQILADTISLMLLQQANPKAGTVELDVEKLIQQYDFDAFLVETGRPLYTYLMSHGEAYEMVFSKKGAAYFRRIQADE